MAETSIKDFEAAIAELESIVKKLEEGDLALEADLRKNRLRNDYALGVPDPLKRRSHVRTMVVRQASPVNRAAFACIDQKASPACAAELAIVAHPSTSSG